MIPKSQPQKPESCRNANYISPPFKHLTKNLPFTPTPHQLFSNREKVNRMPLDIDFMPSYDPASIVAEMRRVAAITGRNKLTSDDFKRFGRVSAKTAAMRFGSLEKAHVAAGLDSSHFKKFTNEDLLKMLADLWVLTLRDSGRSPVVADVAKYGLPVCGHTIAYRFGSWRKALIATSEATHGRMAQPFPPPIRTRAHISARIRFNVFKRDKYTCRICRQSGVELVLDHVIPVCRGGTDAIANLQALCVPCNLGKGGDLQ